MRLDEIVAFGGLLALGLVGWVIWWRLGVAEERERRERENAAGNAQPAHGDVPSTVQR